MLYYEEYPFSPAFALQGGESNLLVFLKGKGTEYAFVEPQEVFRMPQGSAVESKGNGIEQLEADLITGLQTADRDSLLSTLRLLQALDNFSPASTSVLKRLVAASDAGIALAVHAVLLKTGDPEEVAQFAAFEEKNRKGDFLRLITIGSTLNGVRNVQALPSLSQLSDSPTIPIKLGALEAIRAIKNAKSIPTLIKHLDDSDAMARYISVMALSEITKKTDGPFMGSFQEDESKYINIWKIWWEQEGRAIYEIQGMQNLPR